jgi:PHD/YefM family antitoxin component YafN of YafNO toxin-antitoxin module
MKAVPGMLNASNLLLKGHMPSFLSVNLDLERIDVAELHRMVLKQTGRVELVTRDGQETVLITKSELRALEEALAILSDTQSVRAVREQLERVAALSRNPLVG